MFYTLPRKNTWVLYTVRVKIHDFYICISIICYREYFKAEDRESVVCALEEEVVRLQRMLMKARMAEEASNKSLQV